MLKVTLTSGLVGKRETHRKVVRALGLGKYGSSRVHADTPVIRGMINKVRHLVTVVPASADETTAHKAASKEAQKPVATKAGAKSKATAESK